MSEIKPRDIRFAKTDENEGNRPTDIIISSSFKKKDWKEICIVIDSEEKNGFVFLSDLYYTTSKDLHYFNLKKIERWDKIKTIVIKFFYRSGTEKRLRLKEQFLKVRFEKKGPRTLAEEN